MSRKDGLFNKKPGKEFIIATDSQINWANNFTNLRICGINKSKIPSIDYKPGGLRFAAANNAEQVDAFARGRYRPFEQVPSGDQVS